MNKQDLISVIVPVYNVENYLKRCLDSIINQTYQNIEIILIDDGSTDNSGNLCEDYKKIDNRIRVIHKTNGGLSDARNIGIESAKGKYITFVDSDDYIHDEFIHSMYCVLVDNDCQIVSCGMKKFLKPIKRQKNYKTKFKVFNNIDAVEYSLYEKKIDNSVCNKLFNIDLFKKVKFPKGKYFEDLATTYKLFLKSTNIAYLDMNLYYYFQNPTSIIHTNNEKKIEDLYSVSQEMSRNLSQIYNLDKALNARLINIYFYICRESSNELRKKECYKQIKKMRKKVLRDKNSSFKTKVGILSSYFGIKFTNLIFNIYRKVLL